MNGGQVAPWAARFIGIPFRDGGRDRDGIDCWGVLRLVYGEVLGVELPAYDGVNANTADRAELERLMDGGIGAWCEVSDRELRTGDGVRFRVADARCHVAVHAGAGMFLHAEKDLGVVLERYGAIGWRHRKPRFYRHWTQAGGVEPAHV